MDLCVLLAESKALAYDGDQFIQRHNVLKAQGIGEFGKHLVDVFVCVANREEA